MLNRLLFLTVGAPMSADAGVTRPLQRLCAAIGRHGIDARYIVLGRSSWLKPMRHLAHLGDPIAAYRFLRLNSELTVQLKGAVVVAVGEAGPLLFLRYALERHFGGNGPSVLCALSMGSQRLEDTALQHGGVHFSIMYRALGGPIHYGLFMAAARLADLTLAPTISECKWARGRGIRCMHVPWGYDEWHDPWIDNPKRLIWFDNWTARKNWPWFVRVSSQALQEGLVERIDIFGTQGAASTEHWPTSVRGHVHVYGHLPRQALHRQLSAGGTCISPSYSEGFGIGRVEAVAAGCLLLGTPTGWIADHRDQLSDVIIDPCDPSAGLATLRRLTGDQAARASAMNQLRAAARAYSWQSSADKLLDVLTSIPQRGQ